MDWKDFIAGGVGGGISVLCSHPFDTIKVRLQTTNKYSGIRDCMRKMLQQEGARSLFKGMSFPLCSVAIINCIAFGSYSTTMRLISKNPDDPMPIEVWFAGAVTGVSVCILSPVELIKIRLQTVTGKMASPFAMTADVYNRGGIFSSSGLYRGVGAQLARDPFGYSLYFLPYVFATKFLEERDLLRDPCSVVVAGAFAGVLSWLITNPFDVIKSRYQSDFQETSSRSCFTKLFKTEGMNGFTRGILANSLRGIPQSGALFLGYESTLKLLKDYD